MIASLWPIDCKSSAPEEGHLRLEPGACVGTYEIIGVLGVGGMGEVYRARDTRLKRDVAVKALPEQCSRHPESVARFQREAEVLAWVAQGKSNNSIGAILGISPRTVQKHLERTFTKLGVESRTAAAAQALAVVWDRGQT